MAASVKGTPNSAAATSVTIPSHAVGDMIVIFAYRDGSTTVPSKPSASGTVPAWVDINNSSGANTNSCRTAYFVATATNHTSGTWTNATGMVAVVVQGHVSKIGGSAQGGSTSSTQAVAPSITMSDTSGDSLLLQFFGHRTVTAWSTAPTGYTRQTSVATEVACNTKDSTTSDGSSTQSLTAGSSSGYRCQQVEIMGRYTGTTAGTLKKATASLSGTSTTPKMSALVDTFASKDTAKWTWSSGAGVSSGRLSIPCTSSWDSVVSTGVYDLTGSYLVMEIPQRANEGTGTTQTVMGVSPDPVNSLDTEHFAINGTYLQFWENVAGTPSWTDVTYSATNHRWMRIRESGGTVYWDTSPNGIDWTNRRSKAAGITLTAVYATAYTGYSGDETDPGTALFDNVNNPPANGPIAATLKKATASLSGSQSSGVTGTLAATLHKATAAATGTHTQTGVQAGSLKRATASLTGYMRPAGTVAATLAKSVAALAGSHTQTGVQAGTLKPVSASLSGYMLPAGGITATLTRATVAATGGQIQTGAVAATVAKLGAALTGTTSGAPTGQITGSLPKPVAALAGSQIQTGSVAGTLQRATASLTGFMQPKGSGAGLLKRVTAALTGYMVPKGRITGTLKRATAHGHGHMEPAGPVTGTLKRAAASVSGRMEPAGQIAATLPRATATAVGTHIQAGVQAGTLKPVTATATGYTGQEGQIAATLARAVFTGQATHQQVGAIVATLAAARITVEGRRDFTGSVTVTLRGLTTAATGSASGGHITATLRPATSSSTGEQLFTAALAAMLKAPTADVRAAQQQVGVVAATAKTVGATLDGIIAGQGVLAAALRPVSMTAAATVIQWHLTGVLAAELATAAVAGGGWVLPHTPPDRWVAVAGMTRDVTPTGMARTVTPAGAARDVTPTGMVRDVTPVGDSRDVTPVSDGRDYQL